MTLIDPFTNPGPSPRAPRVQNFRYKLLNPETNKPETWSRVTTFARTLAETSALNAWEIRMVVKGLAMAPQALSSAAEWDVAEHKAAFAVMAKDAKERAGGNEGARRGTRMHDLTEVRDRGQELPGGVSASERCDVDAYSMALGAAKLEVMPEFIERFVAIPQYRVCGKLDRIYGVDGELRIGDVKTAKNLDYGWLEIVIQLGLYSMATHYWDDASDAWIPMPENLSRARGVVTHLPVGSGFCDVYEVDLAAGAAAAAVCETVRAFRARKNLATPLWLGSVNAPRANPYAERIRLATCVDDLRAVWREASAAGAWTPELEAQGKARQREFA